MVSSRRHHQHAIDNFAFVGAASVKTDPKCMWRIRLFQLICIGLVAIVVVQGLQRAGVSVPFIS